MTTLTAWLMTVARAAPPAPMRRPATKATSRMRFSTAEMQMKMKGRVESPIPRRMAEVIL